MKFLMKLLKRRVPKFLVYCPECGEILYSSERLGRAEAVAAEHGFVYGGHEPMVLYAERVMELIDGGAREGGF